MEAMRNGGAHILYPAPAPDPGTLKTKGIRMKDVSCEKALFNPIGPFNISSPRVQLGNPGVLCCI